MSHNYLLDTYEFLRQRMDKAQLSLTDADAQAHTRQYAAGQIEAICSLERFLRDRYDIKLPRRLRQQRRLRTEICKQSKG